MALFKKKPKTSAQKASQAKMRILARLLGCGYLIYLVVDNFIGVSPEELGMSQTIKYAVISIFLGFAGVLLVLSAFEIIRAYKAGMYNEAFYTSDPGAEASYESAEDKSDVNKEGEENKAVEDDIGDDVDDNEDDDEDDDEDDEK